MCENNERYDCKIARWKKTMQSMCIKTEHFNIETPQNTLYYEKNA